MLSRSIWGRLQPSMAGPKRPQDRVLLKDMKAGWRKDLAGTFAKPQPSAPVTVKDNGIRRRSATGPS